MMIGVMMAIKSIMLAIEAANVPQKPSLDTSFDAAAASPSLDLSPSNGSPAQLELDRTSTAAGQPEVLSSLANSPLASPHQPLSNASIAISESSLVSPHHHASRPPPASSGGHEASGGGGGQASSVGPPPPMTLPPKPEPAAKKVIQLSADEMLPLIIFLLCQFGGPGSPARFYMMRDWMTRVGDPSECTERGYYATMFASAVEFILASNTSDGPAPPSSSSDSAGASANAFETDSSPFRQGPGIPTPPRLVSIPSETFVEGGGGHTTTSANNAASPGGGGAERSTSEQSKQPSTGTSPTTAGAPASTNVLSPGRSAASVDDEEALREMEGGDAGGDGSTERPRRPSIQKTLRVG